MPVTLTMTRRQRLTELNAGPDVWANAPESAGAGTVFQAAEHELAKQNLVM